jgi:superfamily II DNA or RNA helicase
LRDYQSAATTSIHAAFESHSRVLAVLATGLGKTVIFSTIAAGWTNGRALVVAPMIELIGQAAKKIRRITGQMPAIEQADQWSNESSWAKNQFIVGSKQTLCAKGKRYQRFEDVGLLVLDEADNMLTQPVAEMVDWYVDLGAKVLGVTATPKRHDRKAMKNVFETCAYEMSIFDAVEAGWLVAPKAHCIQLESLDLSQVGTKGKHGDFKDGELARAMEDDKVVFEVAEVTARESGPLKTVVYCASVEEARKISHRLVDNYQLKADWVCGDVRLCDKTRRRKVLGSFTDDPEGIQIVCNVGVLTRGWDFPALQHIVMARPTRSLNLYCQIMGRGTRPLDGIVDFEGSTPELRRAAIAASRKPHFKVTDLRDNTLAHKLVTTADVLGGKMGLGVVERAKKIMAEFGAAMDVDEALKQAQTEIEKRERAKLRRIESRAKYKRLEADPFDADQRSDISKPRPSGARMPFGRHKGKSFAELPDFYLRWLTTNIDSPRWNWVKGSAWGEINRRKKARQPAVAVVDDFWSKLKTMTETVHANH